MAWTIQEYNAIKKAYALGLTEVAYGDRRQKFRSLDEMERIIARMEEEIGPKPRKGNGRRYASCSSGVRT